MKRFLLFEGLEYYPSGGVYDFVKDFDTLEEAQSQNKEDIDWQNILDLETGKYYSWEIHIYEGSEEWHEIMEDEIR